MQHNQYCNKQKSNAPVHWRMTKKLFSNSKLWKSRDNKNIQVIDISLYLITETKLT